MRSLRTGWGGVALSLLLIAACGNDASGESSDSARSSNLNPATVRQILENGARGPGRCSFLTNAQAERLVEDAGESVERILEEEPRSGQAGIFSACDLFMELAMAKPSVGVYRDAFPYVEDSFEGFDRAGQFACLNDDDSDLDWGAFYLENDLLVSIRTGPSDVIDLDETVAMLDELLTILEEEVASG